MKPHRRVNAVIETVCTDLEGRAEFFREHMPDNRYHPRLYLRLRETGEIIDLFEGSHLHDLLTQYSLQLKTGMIRMVAEHVCQRVRRSGTPVKVCSAFHYDPKTFALYVSVDPLRVLKMTGTAVEYVGNVVDGFLFLPHGEPIDVDLEVIRGSALGLHVEPGSLMHQYFDASYADDSIPAEYNRQLVCARILSLFFPDHLATRPMLIIDGEPGSGKTWLAKKIGLMVHGSTFEVSMLSSKREQVEILLTTDPVVVLDNLDEPALVRKNNSLLCQAVTGGKVNKRRLYTDNTMLSYPLIANLICTSIDLSWVRNTIADRALIIRLAPRVKDGRGTPDENLKAESLKIRNALMTEVLGRCRNIVIALQAQAEYIPPHILRLHDLTGFIMRCAVHEGWSDNAIDMLHSVAGAQHEEADANNPVLDVIKQYIGRFPKESKDPLTATSLGKRLKHAADDLKLDARFEWGAYGMRGVLNKQFSSLRKKFGMQRARDARNNSYMYWFEPTPEQLEICKDFARETDCYGYYRLPVEAL